MEPEPIQGDKLLLCRLCLANGFNTTFVVHSIENETILKKHNILFTVNVRSLLKFIFDF